MSNDNIVQCPKCAYVRRTVDNGPSWQCPACGIAYRKYSKYLDRVKQVAEPRTAVSGPAAVTADGSIWMLIATNVFVLIIAIATGWRLVDMMLVFWIQSVIIGISYLMRIASLDRFSTRNFQMNNKTVEPTPETRRQVAVFFAMHYGFFHLVYAVFLLSGEFGDPRLGLDLLICAGAFAVNHFYSYRYHRELDEQGTPNIGTLMFTPYARIVPMHLTIIIGSTMAPGAGVLLFGTLKTFADAVMHQIEHRMIAHHDE